MEDSGLDVGPWWVREVVELRMFEVRYCQSVEMDIQLWISYFTKYKS